MKVTKHYKGWLPLITRSHIAFLGSENRPGSASRLRLHAKQDLFVLPLLISVVTGKHIACETQGNQKEEPED